MCLVMDMFLFANEQNAHDLLLHNRHIEMSEASDWPSHTGNRPDT